MARSQSLRPLLSRSPRLRRRNLPTIRLDTLRPFLRARDLRVGGGAAARLVALAFAHADENLLRFVDETPVGEMGGTEFEVSGADSVAVVAEDFYGAVVAFDGGAVEGVAEGYDALRGYVSRGLEDGQYEWVINLTLTFAFASGLARATPLRTTIAP